MDFYKIIKENSILTIKIAVIVFIILGISSGVDYKLTQTGRELSLSQRQTTSSLSKDANQEEIQPNLILKAIANGFLDVIDNLGITVLAQSNLHIGSFKTKCGWRVASITSLAPNQNYPNPPNPGITDFWRDTCQDMNGDEYPPGDPRKYPPTCNSITGASTIDAGVSCYPTGIDMNNLINGVLLTDFPNPPTVFWFFYNQYATVGVCERSCIWNEAEL